MSVSSELWDAGGETTTIPNLFIYFIYLPLVIILLLREVEENMKTLTRFLFIALFLVSLSGCAGTYTAIGTDPGQPNHPNNCPMMNDQDCHAWFYGSGSP